MALAEAIDRLQRDGVLKHSPLKDYMAAVSVGLVGGEPVLDLEYEEDSRADVDMNVVMTGSGQFIEVQGTAERATFDEKQLLALLALARKGIHKLISLQRQLVKL